MLAILGNRVFRLLFSAQVIALLGTGMMTVALGLLAYDLAGARAGAVLGTALAIKMIAYVGIAPLASALAESAPRKSVLIGADLLRASVALALPFVDAVWQVYSLIFLLQAASATFTPAFQAMIPDVLESEADYTRALSLSRLAYDLENLISPTLAGILLLVVSYSALFAGTVVGFLGSAVLVSLAAVPRRPAPARRRSFGERLMRGGHIYMATPRLRGLLALNLSAAAAGAFVIVNTVVIVRAGYDGPDAHVAYALASFGGGSMLAALVLPSVLDRFSDRAVMLAAGGLLSLVTLAYGLWMLVDGLMAWACFLAGWAANGMLYSAVLTPSGRLLRRSSNPDDRAALFAVQFALSHACWLLTYPMAGWAGSLVGMPATMLLLGLLSLCGVAAAVRVWPAGDPTDLIHEHPDLSADHPHLLPHGRRRHRHVFVIDDEHRAWPTAG